MISDIKVWLLKKPNEKIKANCQFVVDNAWKMKGTLMNGAKGLFVGLPGKWAQELKDGKMVDKLDEKTGKKIWYPDVACIDHEAQRQLNEAIIQEYNKQVGNSPSNQGTAPGPTDQTSKRSNIPFG